MGWCNARDLHSHCEDERSEGMDAEAGEASAGRNGPFAATMKAASRSERTVAQLFPCPTSFPTSEAAADERIEELNDTQLAPTLQERLENWGSD